MLPSRTAVGAVGGGIPWCSASVLVKGGREGEAPGVGRELFSNEGFRGEWRGVLSAVGAKRPGEAGREVWVSL